MAFSPSNFEELVGGRTKLEHLLRFDGGQRRKLGVDAIGQSCCGAFHCDNGVFIDALPNDKYSIVVTTIDDQHVVLSMRAQVDTAGRLVGAMTYNAFGLGLRKSSDQVDIDAFIDEIHDFAQHDNDYWDVVVT